MSDFPDQFTPGVNRGLLTPFGDTPWGDFLGALGQGYGNTAQVWTANRAVYQPIHVEVPCTVTQIAVRVQTQNGNLDVGIYDWENNLKVSLGSTAVAAAGVQLCNIADTYLVPGWYKLALSCNSSTAVFKNHQASAAGPLRACGLQEQTSGAFALPNPATPIALSGLIIPWIVASCRTTL